ncbi:MAG: nicotinate-nucleotide--dimethylbenzimidazole phosphoribosyltransferase [Mariprofundaceae bacterium]|nr:nicotinate-nucleotide--dimethylbenzimidazole phosphoribosyltransferase [Mariprofundaceae bacterium]
MSVAKISLQALKAARQHQDFLTKPQGALGHLEDIACWFAARQGKAIPDAIVPHICVFAADHGVVDEGVSAFPSVVTGEMVKNFVAGGAAINVLAAQCGASLSIVDVGVASDMSAIEGIVHANIRHGSRNIVHEAAMSDDEYRQAIRVGEQQAEDAIANGANLLIAGDMGIGNTTPSAALICELALLPPELVVGRGTGVADDAYQLKLAAVRQALVRAKNTPFPEVLRELGGLEIAAMAGYYAAAARLGVPVLLDGFISTAAALAAVAWDARIAGWMLASHVSEELGHQKALEALGLDAYLNFRLRLGEGSGAALLVPLLQSAIALHRNMATFASAGVSDKDG